MPLPPHKFRQNGSRSNRRGGDLRGAGNYPVHHSDEHARIRPGRQPHQQRGGGAISGAQRRGDGL